MKSQIPRMTRQELYNLIEEAQMDLSNMDTVSRHVIYNFTKHHLSGVDAESAYIATYIVKHAKGCE